jgi:hypothetical protein
MRPLSITTSEPMLFSAITDTASLSLPSGAIVKKALPSPEDFAHLHGFLRCFPLKR